MEIDQNLLVDNIDYSDVIFNIDEYLPCYDEVSYQTIDNILQTTSPPTDMSMTTTLIKQANTETDITALPSNVSSSESLPNLYRSFRHHPSTYCNVVRQHTRVRTCQFILSPQ